VSHGLIDSTEMYLRTVLALEEEGIPALRARLAERLGLSAPSVSEGVSRLVDDGLVELSADRTVQLTGTGRDIATTVMRKHRLAERLLVDVLGLEHEHVHEEACRWEHVISDRVEEKLLAFLGNPTTSPYGNPIPGVGDAADFQIVTLADVEGPTVRVERISEQLQGDHGAMHAFDEAGITIGSSVDVAQEPGRTTVTHAGNRVVLPVEQARLVYVSEL
jgi:DtxR family transcriptional regulator, Mn-dependent transcriptional regulator